MMVLSEEMSNLVADAVTCNMRDEVGAFRDQLIHFLDAVVDLTGAEVTVGQLLAGLNGEVS